MFCYFKGSDQPLSAKKRKDRPNHISPSTPAAFKNKQFKAFQSQNGITTPIAEPIELSDSAEESEGENNEAEKDNVDTGNQPGSRDKLLGWWEKKLPKELNREPESQWQLSM
jgi:hypothetical protein